MTRLTNALKDRISQNAIEKSGLNAKKKELSAEYDALGEEIRAHLIGGKEGEKLAKAIAESSKKRAARIPKLADVLEIKVNKERYLHVNADGEHHTFRFSDKDGKLEWRICTSGYRKTLNCNVLKKKLRSILKRQDENKNAICDLELEVYSVMAQATTVSKLLKVWPEAEELLPKTENQKANLPVIPLASINKKIFH